MRSVCKNFVEGVLAGLLIVIGCSVFVACVIDGLKWLGAIFFSVALLTICIMGFNLYTGKIGFIVNEHKKENFETLLIGILGNVVSTFVFGWLVGLALPALKDKAIAMVSGEGGKLSQTFVQTLIRGTFCGVLMYVAVSIYKEKKNLVGILFAIPVFILSGFEHSIADMGYFSIAFVANWQSFAFIMTVVLGNTIGAMIIPGLRLIVKGKEKPTEENKNSEKEVEVKENEKN